MTQARCGCPTATSATRHTRTDLRTAARKMGETRVDTRHAPQTTRIGSRNALQRAAAVIAGSIALSIAAGASALEFRATTEPATILYDGPSVKSQKLFVVGRDYPFEVVVSVEGWVKVRDVAGAPLAWVEKKALGDRRIVAVKVPIADVLATAEANGKMVFRVEQNVLLELVERPVSGWVRVRHRDGQSGYISISHIWGV